MMRFGVVITTPFHKIFEILGIFLSLLETLSLKVKPTMENHFI